MGSRNGIFLLLNNKIERLLMVPNIFVSVVDYTIFVYSKS